MFLIFIKERGKIDSFSETKAEFMDEKTKSLANLQAQGRKELEKEVKKQKQKKEKGVFKKLFAKK